MELELGCVAQYATGKSGIVRFVGPVDFADGEWVGLELERPDGKNNGSIGDRVYFIKAVLSRPGDAAASRLQQLRDRRASGVGATSSLLRPPGAAPAASFSRSSSIATPPGSASGVGGAAAARKSVVGSAGGTTPAPSRLSLDGNARRATLAPRAAVAPTTSSVSDEQLADARARIAKLEEELEQKTRSVEQLKQSLAVAREAKAAASVVAVVVEETPDTDADAGAETADADDSSRRESDAADEPMDVDVDAGADAVAALEAELLAKVEAVKREAEEHVRSVRAGLEAHVAKLEADRDAQVSELRDTNAAQAAARKALEAEVAQQKLRLAQFAAAEQKRAEDAAHALAKQSTGARRVEALEAQVAELQEMAETMALEKETLEMDREIAEERVEECVEEIEKLRASLALATAVPEHASSSSSSSAAPDELADENRKLRAAVKALHERSSEEKAELSKKLRQHQREHTELLALREEVEQLTTKRATLEAEVEELKELLDLANAYESMVEDLTEKNLSLGDRVADLEATVLSLESLKEMAEEMEHQHAEYEDELRAEIDAQRAGLQDAKQAVADLKTVIDDRDRTIARFRDLAQAHRDEIEQLKAKLRVESGALASLQGETHSALNQSMGLRALAAAARAHEAEAAKHRVNAEQAGLEIAFFRAVVPSAILSEADHRMLRVRLRLGRVAGKADVLVQFLQKDLALGLQHDAAREGGAGASSGLSLLESARSIQQLLLGEKLAAAACQAREGLFLLECHLTTEDEFAQCCAQLDAPPVAVLEAALDTGLAAFADGTLLASRAGEATAYERLATALDEWRSSRQAAAPAASASTDADVFPRRCAVVKLQARRSVRSLSFSLAAMLTFVRSVQLVAAGGAGESDALRVQLLPAVDALVTEAAALVAMSQHFLRRAEIDLAPSDEDLDGGVAVGGDALELVHAYAAEGQSLWIVLEDQLSFGRLQEAPADVVAPAAASAAASLLALMVSLKDKVGALFKQVCRGAFTDAIAGRARSPADLGADGRPQWRIRAQAIHSELLNAAGLRGRLHELGDVCQALQARVRELERADSQFRVVTQKLESEALRLTESVALGASDKAQLEAQLTREREQFAATLDDRNKPAALSHGDAEAFRGAFAQLRSDLHRVRGTLAKERLDRALGSPIATPVATVATPAVSDRLATSLRRVAAFSTQVKAQMAMPRLVDLAQHPSATAAHSELVATKLARTKTLQTLAELRAQIGSAMRADGWGADVVRAIERGESVFGWQPPEMERPALLLGRVTLSGGGGGATSDSPATTPLPVVPLLLNRSEVAQLSRTLVC
ncbi:hypothetical protein PybrP1_009868 [[Pythium] brassicae (nom. inval.)]|nr:hypothetical protein PybrP1_009868 [[Pythium] brassicae (nom. inval.)]